MTPAGQSAEPPVWRQQLRQSAELRVALWVFVILEKPRLGDRLGFYQRCLQSGPLLAQKAFEGQDRTASVWVGFSPAQPPPSRPAANPSHDSLTHLPGFVFSRLLQAHCTFSPLIGLARFLIPSRTVMIMADTGRGFFPEKDFRHHCAQTDLHLSCRVYFNFQWEEGANRYF